jgi:uncharacterized membrane protein
MSELGARGRATARIHPFINNYPIGILATVFGFATIGLLGADTLSRVAGVLLVVHGVSQIAAGVFPLDEDLGAGGQLSLAHKLHGIAGLLMYFSLLFACLCWVFIAAPGGSLFTRYSLASVIASLVSLGFMVRALKTGRNFGLHQRISFGLLELWSAVLSVLLFIGVNR